MRTLIAAMFGAAAVALVIVNSELTTGGNPTPHLALATLAFAIGVGLGLAWRNAVPSSTTLPEAASMPGTVIDTHPVTLPIEDRTILTFARHLLAVTNSEELRNIVETQLPHVLNGRKVWIAGERLPQARDRRDRLVEVYGRAWRHHELDEWTTFALRIGEQHVGILGVETDGAIPPELKQRIQAVMPLLAQALKTVHEVDEVREASVVDLLTGAATRREGLSRLEVEIKRAQRTGSTMAVLMMDLDHFKAINDRHGHAVGDALLTAIGETLAKTLRASDVRCRWGGEEFLIVLPDTSLAQAQVVATHVLQNVAATAVPSAQGPVSSTASVGLTISRPAETDVSRIVDRADLALYQAKNAGRGCVRVVLAGFDGEPIGTARPETPGTPPSETLPFPDRRNPNRSDRRRLPGPGRRRTDAPLKNAAVSAESRVIAPTTRFEATLNTPQTIP